MIKIRLKRMGMKKKPFYRIVVADVRSPRDGRFVEEIGYYNPLTDPAEIKIDVEKAAQWLKNGAQPTDTVRALLGKVGVVESKATGLPPKKPAQKKAPAYTPAKKEEVKEEAPVTIEAAQEE